MPAPTAASARASAASRGRFGNGTGSQTLNLGGLTAGQTYTLAFDLYALDSWDGTRTGPTCSTSASTAPACCARRWPTSAGSAQTLRASAGIVLQVVPTLDGIDGSRPGEDSQFNLRGSGFMEGASTVTIGGVVMPDTATNLSPFDVTGSRNDRMTVVAPTHAGRADPHHHRRRLCADRRRVSTRQPISVFSAITATAGAGVPADAGRPSANTGQTIVLNGQGFTSSTLVQFQGVDDSGVLGTLTRTGSAGNNGTTLSVVVPALARSGAVTVLGSGTAIDLQVVPTLRAFGGTVAAGNTIAARGQRAERQRPGHHRRRPRGGQLQPHAPSSTAPAPTPTSNSSASPCPPARSTPSSSSAPAAAAMPWRPRCSSITASAGSGTAALAGVASANAGQSIVLNGSGLLASDRLVFSTIDISGNLGEITVTPTIDLAQQTLTVTVPDTATTGRLRLLRECRRPAAAGRAHRQRPDHGHRQLRRRHAHGPGQRLCRGRDQC